MKLLLFAFTRALGVGISLLGVAPFGGTANAHAGRIGGMSMLALVAAAIMIARNAIPFAVGQFKAMMALFTPGWIFTVLGLRRAAQVVRWGSRGQGAFHAPIGTSCGVEINGGAGPHPA